MLPIPPPCSPVVRKGGRLQRPAPKPVCRSARVAQRRRAGSSVSRQQKLLISRLSLANEGETIGDEALAAYIRLFEKPLSSEHMAAIVALFGWEPDLLPLFGEDQPTLLVV